LGGGGALFGRLGAFPAADDERVMAVADKFACVLGLRAGAGERDFGERAEAHFAGFAFAGGVSEAQRPRAGFAFDAEIEAGGVFDPVHSGARGLGLPRGRDDPRR
jgi:hypothetical protein